MTFALGRAQLILDANAQPLVESTTKAYAQVRRDSEAAAKQIADSQKASVNDVRQAATIIIQERKKLADALIAEEKRVAKEAQDQTKVILDANKKLYAEETKLAKEAAREREAATKVILKANDDEVKAKLAAEKAVAKEKEAQTKVIIKANQDEAREIAKAIADRQRADAAVFAAAQKQLAEDRAARSKRAKEIFAEEKAIEKARIDSINKVVAAEARARLEGTRQRAADARAQTISTSIEGNRGILSGIGIGNAGGTAATLLGFGAIASTAVIARAAIVGMTEAVNKQEQAQRSLNTTFGKTQILYKENADALAKQFGLVSSTVEQATVSFAGLDRQTVLTGTQIRGLNKIAIDNAALIGGDVLEAHKDLQNAILGETEGYEKYGLVLQEGVLKSSSLLTEDERKRFTIMSESEKQMIRYRLILEAANGTMGAAAERAKSAAGGFDALNRSADELSKTVGTGLVGSFGGAARELSGIIIQIDNFMFKFNKFQEARNKLIAEGGIPSLGPLDLFPNAVSVGRDIVNGPAIRARAQADIAAAERARAHDRELAQIREFDQNVEKERIAARDKEEAELRAARERIEASLRFAHDKEIEQIEERKKAAEGERDVKLRAMEEVHKQNIKNIEEIEYARKQASAAELRRIEKERDDKFAALDAEKDRQLELIDSAKDATHQVADEQIRQLNIEKDHREKLNELALATDKKRLEAEKRERDHAREVEDRKIADSIGKEKRAREDKHKIELRQLDDEKDAEKDKYDEVIKSIDKKNDAEDQRHTKEVRRIEDEHKKKLDDVQAQIDGIEAVQKARENARKLNDIQDRASEARKNLVKAQGTGTPEQIAAARSKLTGAIRIGDPTAVKKAEDELVEISGHGAEEIAKAQKDLKDAEADLTEQNLKTTEDANKQKLEDTKDAISQELEAEKRKEEDKAKKIKDNLARAKNAAKEQTDDEIKNLDKRKDKFNDTYEADVRKAEDTATKKKRILDDSRKKEDEAYKNAQDAAQERYKNEQDEIAETYTSDEHGLIPAIQRATKEQDEQYETQKKGVQARYKKEREEIDATYNDPVNGLIAVHRLVEEAAQHQYSLTLAVANARYDAEQKKVNDLYRNPDGKSGILDRLDEQKNETDRKLTEILKIFDAHAKGLVGPGGIIEVQWKEAEAQAKRYFDYLDQRRKQQEIDSKNPPKNTQNPSLIGPGPNPDGGAPGVILPNPDYTGSGGSSGSSTLPGATTTGATKEGKNIDNPYGNKKTGQYIQITSANEVVELGSVPNSVAPGIQLGIKVDNDKLEKEIREAFTKRINSQAADDAVQVWEKEGKSGYIGDFGTSFGPFQLHTPGLATQFIQDTGMDPRDPESILWQVAWVANYVAKNGWNNQWHGAPGYNSNGGSTGIAVRKYDIGGMFMSPTWTYDPRTKQHGVIAEQGPERLLGRRETAVLNTSPISRSSNMSMDMSGVGAALGGMGSVNNMTEMGDTLNYYGVAPESLIQMWRDDQRRQRVLKGRVK